jgi:hypothetical protein
MLDAVLLPLQQWHFLKLSGIKKGISAYGRWRQPEKA